MERRPAVAGQFYSKNPRDLKKEVTAYLQNAQEPITASAVVAPHAGYIYSGAVAGKVFGSINVPQTCILLGPNHHGLGQDAAITSHGSWIIPTGRIPVDSKLAESLKSSCVILREDALAHLKEHSLEVLLPFLLERQQKLEIVPIALSRLTKDDCKTLGMAIAQTIRLYEKPVLIVASTDMNHYESQTATLEKDRMAIDAVLSLDGDGLLETCANHGISMCGVVPVATAIFASKALGAKQAILVEHKTSGDICGDYDSVVGYAGFIMH
jgi:hypothetical protein